MTSQCGWSYKFWMFLGRYENEIGATNGMDGGIIAEIYFCVNDLRADKRVAGKVRLSADKSGR